MNKLGIAKRKYPILWSSTKFKFTTAWVQYFGYDQHTRSKTNRFWVRAIRRKPKTNLAFKNNDHV